MYERDRCTNGPHDDVGLACIALHGKNWNWEPPVQINAAYDLLGLLTKDYEQSR